MIYQTQHRNSPANRRLYALYEIAHTAVDFGAALSFVVGSVLFFFEETQTEGTWLFVLGSILFAAKPSLRLARELHLLARGRDDRLAERASG